MDRNAESSTTIPEKRGVYQIEAERGALYMTRQFPCLTLNDTELVQKIQNVKRFGLIDVCKEQMALVK